MKPQWYAQQNPSSCVAACVRMVLTTFNEFWTEAEVLELLGRPKIGITLWLAAQRLAQGGTISFHADWNLYDLRDTLRKKVYPIVGAQRQFLGYPPASHAVVLVSLTSKRVGVLDPLIGPQIQYYNVKTFETAWKMAGPDALIIETPPIHLIRFISRLINE